MTGTAEVIAALKAAGIRTVSAYPGGRRGAAVEGGLAFPDRRTDSGRRG